MIADQNQLRFQTRLQCQTVIPARRLPNIAEDARDGLLSRPRTLPPKYFYDEHGSRLFERICATPEYYPSRCEAALLERHADDIMVAADPLHIVELGSGSARKTRHLFDACERQRASPIYWPFDVAQGMLLDSGRQLIEDYDWLRVRALEGDYLGGLDHMPLPDGDPRLFVFLGGTIGNFEGTAARDFMAEIAAMMGPGDRLLLGADRVKSSAVLTAAYNDAAGVTAAFNLNVLNVLNRELAADFNPGRFRHESVYVSDRQRIEMHLIAREAHSVRIGTLDAAIDFVAEDSIRTEVSRKFHPEDLRALLASAGLEEEHHFEAPDGYYSLVLARPVADDDAD